MQVTIQEDLHAYRMDNKKVSQEKGKNKIYYTSHWLEICCNKFSEKQFYNEDIPHNSTVIFHYTNTFHTTKALFIA